MFIDEWGEIHTPEKAKPLTSESLAAREVGVPEQPDRFDQKLSRYGTAKARNRQMAGFVAGLSTSRQNEHRMLSKRMYDCAAHLGFRFYIDSSTLTLHSGNFCKAHLLCPVCAIRRGAKTLRTYHERALFLADRYDFHLVTLTVKNGPDLFERYQLLKHAFKRLRERGRKGYGEWSRVAGAVWSTEFTHSPEKGWHPHLHMIVALDKGDRPIRYGEGSQLRADWLAATGDSYIVHSRQISGGAPSRGGVPQDLAASLCEVLKYAVKFSDLDLAKNWEAYQALRGKRLLQSSGCFFGLELPEDDPLTDDPMDGPYLDFFFRYTSNGYLMVPQGGDTFAPERTQDGNSH
jgi:hypothetical protein